MDDQVVDFTSTWIGTRPTLDDQLLALPVLAAHPMLAPVFEALRSIRSYAIDPAKIREPQDPDEGRFLFTDGSNSTSVFRKLSPSARESVIELLAHAVPSIIDIKIVSRGPKLTTQFVQRTQSGRMTFDAHQMSDGTLRLVGILLALYQKADTAFVAIEEPEASVHVAAAEALVELFVTQSDDVQILMTTHSADVLDFVDVSSLRLVRAGLGYSELAPIADHTREVVKSELFRPGELLRANALRGEGETDVLPQEQ
ncbi:MAG TPA: AAA family ATPase [Solirubrobacteraceae bacterium]|jgi:predicted ATPase|nr:AAA family ATPase [Solirubrobacteraceae bacterium]